MLTKENEVERICSFYASDFHLEMMMLPFINRKLDGNAKITILTQKDLRESVEVLISKINLDEEKRKRILELNWSNHSSVKFEIIDSTTEQILFIIGDEEYIEQMNKQLEKINGKISIVNCYELEQIENKVKEITQKHNKILNTLGEKII